MSETVLALPLERITPDPDQPRKIFDAALLSELAASIRANGLLQPITVRAHPTQPGDYLIIAGERRFTADEAERATDRLQDNL